MTGRVRRPPPILPLAALWLATACWTETRPASGRRTPLLPPPPPCPARLIAIVHDADTLAPLTGATVVVETARGRVATALTDALGRFETAAVSPPARIRIYHGAHAVEHLLAPCQPPLRIGVRVAP